MGVCIGSGMSVVTDSRVAAIEAGADARAGLQGGAADLVFVFCSGHHVADPERVLEGVREALQPEVLLGCGAGGVLAAARECEDGPAVAVWAASLGSGRARPFHARARSGPDGVTMSGLPDLSGAAAAILIADPFSFPADRALAAFAQSAPGTPVLGGIASARAPDGAAALYLDGAPAGDGAVGVALEGVEVLPCVSQGAAPIGPELVVTDAERNLIRELGGKPALDVLRRAIEELDPRERALITDGLLLGVVADPRAPRNGHGDFLVSGIVGADPESGTIAAGLAVETGQIVRLHARNAQSADRDLRDGLALRRHALGARPAGALIFTCNGRGSSMFGAPHHDARAVDEELGGAPAAGFFAGGEFGPVGGVSVVHGFTATVAVFAA